MFEAPAGTVPGPVLQTAVDRLLALEEGEALETALAAVEPQVAARAVAAAPTLEGKTTLLWAMEDRQRREVLEMLPPALVGALVQNLEDDNRYLLGDLSLEQFRALLDLCSPERQFYWVTTALSFTDARANALPLLLTTPELVRILLTRAEFEAHLAAIGEYPIEDARLPPELLVDPAQALVDLIGSPSMLQVFPVADPALVGVLQTILDYDPDRYVDLIRAGLAGLDYQENHPLEWETLTEDPVLLDRVEPIPVLSGEPAAEAAPESGDPGPPLALVSTAAAPLVRLEAALSPSHRRRVAQELQELYVREAVAEGGSFHLADLERAARRVEAGLLLGLQAESGGQPTREVDVLARRPLRKVSQSGARVLERLRQAAVRLRPLEAVFSPEQRALARSLEKPRLILGTDGGPRVALRPGGALPEEVDVSGAAALLQDLAAWSAVARALGLERTARALAAAGGVEKLLEELALGAVLYGRVEIGLAEPDDRRRLVGRYLDRTGRATPVAWAGLRRTVRAWAAERGVGPEAALPLFEAALDRLAGG